MARLKVLFVVPECVPLVKTGGLGDVAGALPSALLRRGHDVRIVMPRYRNIKSYPAQQLPAPLAVPTGSGRRWASVWKAALPSGVPVYLIEHDMLFDRDGIYGDEHGEFGDNLARYAFLSRAALELLDYESFAADLIHVNDWPGALLPVFIALDQRPAPATLLTIHNLGYQGRFALEQLCASGINTAELAASKLQQGDHLNLLKAGLSHATFLSTVSPRYALEIQKPEGGAGLHALLSSRSSELVGILNGIDDVVWNPATDPFLAASYSADDLSGKSDCKRALQRELGLPTRPDVPLLGMVSRLVEQKGLDILLETLPQLLQLDLQIVVLGTGDQELEKKLDAWARKAPHFRARFELNDALAHQIEAGADFFLMPSQYEPCGLNQIYSQRYGTLPIVRAVGGLCDTVVHHENGFVFHDFSGAALFSAIKDAIETYQIHFNDFRHMQKNAMKLPFGWDGPATRYEALYRLVILKHAQTIARP